MTLFPGRSGGYGKIIFNGSIHQITLVDGNGNLKKYVLRHIDSMLDTKDLGKIQNQASHFCPAKNEEFCNGIKVAAEKAAQE